MRRGTGAALKVRLRRRYAVMCVALALVSYVLLPEPACSRGTSALTSALLLHRLLTMFHTHGQYLVALGHGTLLGAVREGRLLPWTHDIDLFMDPADVKLLLADSTLRVALDEEGVHVETFPGLFVRLCWKPSSWWVDAQFRWEHFLRERLLGHRVLPSVPVVDLYPVYPCWGRVPTLTCLNNHMKSCVQRRKAVKPPLLPPPCDYKHAASQAGAHAHAYSFGCKFNLSSVFPFTASNRVQLSDLARLPGPKVYSLRGLADNDAFLEARYVYLLPPRNPQPSDVHAHFPHLAPGAGTTCHHAHHTHPPS